ncbi:MAG: rRNA maturation RNase YbeY [Rhodothalassiaceae bacterium]
MTILSHDGTGDGATPSDDAEPYHCIEAGGWHVELIVRAAVWQPQAVAVEHSLARLLPVLTRQTGAAGSACLVLDSDEAVRRLNAQWRGQDKPTNVLSFPSGEAEPLGDLVLAYGVCAREAAEQGKALMDHVVHLVLHGLLHLLGHNHETDLQADVMEALERAVMAELGLRDPYAVPTVGAGA